MLRFDEDNLLYGLLVIGVIIGGVAWFLWPDNSLMIWSIGLMLGGIVLLIAEALLPTHGVLGVAGLACFGAVICICFYVNRWFGLAVFAGAIVCSPFLANVALKAWMKSPIGRRLIIQNESPTPARTVVAVGQEGRAVTELRPIGECDFGDLRLEAASELGIIPAGKHVKVVAVINGRPTVRVTES